MSENSTIELTGLNVSTEEDLARVLENDLHARGASVRFEGVQKSGDRITGSVVIHWEETVAGKRIVIIDQKIPFDFQGRKRIFEKEIPINVGPIRIVIKVYAEAYFEPPNQVCAVAKAEWPGGSVGTPPTCHSF